MSTLDQLATKVKTKLTGAVGRDKINVLNTTVNTSVTSIVCVYTSSTEIAPGVIIEIGYEQMMIVANSGVTLTVIRAWNGSTAAAHTAQDVIYIEPRFLRQNILDELSNELLALPTGLFKTASSNLTFAAGVSTVDLGTTGTVYRILAAERASLDGASYPSLRLNLRLIREESTGTFASGYAVTIPGGLSYSRSATVRVTVAQPFTTATLTSATDLQAIVGLPVSCEDIVVFGAASRLLSDKEALRLDFTRQGQSRAAEEIPPESQAKQASRWRQDADVRTAHEVRRLMDYWGVPGT
jgi:hypothetical protein